MQSLSGTARAVSPLRNRKFRLILFGQGLSAIGDAVSVTALPLLVLLLTGSGLQMGIVGVLQMLPDLVLGLPAGALADRWDRRRMMLIGDIGRGVLTATIPLSVVLGLDTMLVIYLVVAPINALRVMWLAGYTASVPSLVGRDQIGPANAYLEATYNFGWLVGPGMAGVLASRIGPGPTIAIDSVSFLVSGVSILFIGQALRRAGPPRETHIVTDIREGIAYVAAHATLRSAIALWTSFSIATAGLIPVMAYYVTIDRGLAADALGFIISGYSVGGLAGALIASRLTSSQRSLGALMLGGQAVGGVLIGLLVPAPGLAGMMLVSVVAGSASAVVMVSYITLRTAASPDAMLGRIGSTARTLSLGLQPMGMLASGALLDAIGGAGTLVVVAGFTLAVTTLFAFSGTLRSARLPVVEKHAVPATGQAAGPTMGG